MKRLELAQNRITDFGVAGFAQGLVKNQVLEGLDLSENAIADQGAEALGRAMEWHKSLTNVDVSMNYIESTEAKALATMANRLQKLVGLFLFPGNYIEKEMAKKIQEEKRDSLEVTEIIKQL